MEECTSRKELSAGAVAFWFMIQVSLGISQGKVARSDPSLLRRLLSSKHKVSVFSDALGRMLQIYRRMLLYSDMSWHYILFNPSII